MPSITIYGDRLRQARHLRRMSSKDVAAAMEWSPVRQSRNEQSEQLRISDAELVRLVDVLRFPAKHFVTPPAPRLADPGLLFRAPKRTSLREKDFLKEFGRLVADLVQLLDERHRLPGVAFTAALPGADIVQVAALARARMNLGPDVPIEYLVHAIEKAGVPVVIRPSFDIEGTSDSSDIADSPDHHSGCSGWFGDFGDRPIIVMRGGQSWDRTRLTLAHELGHLLLHRHEVPASAEQDAFRFGTELLGPIAYLRADVPKYPTLNSLRPIKAKWGISIGAIIRHLHDTDNLEDEQYKRLQSQLYSRRNPDTGQTWGVKEPDLEPRATESPRMITAWLERCMGTRSPQALSAITRLWPADLLNEVLAVQRNAVITQAQMAPPPPSQGARVLDFDAMKRLRRG